MAANWNSFEFPGIQNTLAIAYALGGYSIGIALLTQPQWAFNLLGVGLLSHALVIAAVLIHELIHGNVFKNRALNIFWGKLMTHLTGACYAPYEAVVQHHLNHHIYHADFVPFNIPTYFKSLPRLVRYTFLALEWAYVPIFEFILRWRLIVAPFRQPDQAPRRLQAIALLAYRLACCAGLAWISWKAVLLYGLAYVCFVNFMRFADAFHHTYDYVVVGHPIPARDRIYEDEHTFSNLVSERYAGLNGLYLNFGYHNAHHHDMRCPWYELPQLHEKLYGTASKSCLSLPKLVNNYHRFRLKRLFGGQGNLTDQAHQSPQLETFTGGVGVSFLTPP